MYIGMVVVLDRDETPLREPHADEDRIVRLFNLLHADIHPDIYAMLHFDMLKHFNRGELVGDHLTRETVNRHALHQLSTRTLPALINGDRIAQTR